MDLIAKLGGYSQAELGVFAEALYNYLETNFSKEYEVSPENRLVVDILNYKRILDNEIPALLNANPKIHKRKRISNYREISIKKSFRFLFRNGNEILGKKYLQSNSEISFKYLEKDSKQSQSDLNLKTYFKKFDKFRETSWFRK